LGDPDARSKEMAMDENDDLEPEELDDQIEQMIVENGMLIHSVVNLLIRKGVLTQEEIDAEMDKLYDEMDQLAEDEE
jgi:glutathionyl-hydroquinone reductase